MKDFANFHHKRFSIKYYIVGQNFIEVRLTRFQKASREHFVAQFEMKKLEEKSKKYLILFVVSGIISCVLSVYSGIIDVQKIKNNFFLKSYEDEWFYPDNYSENWNQFLEYPVPLICSLSIRVINFSYLAQILQIKNFDY